MLKKGKSNIGKNISELKKDNLKKGTAKGAGGTPRPMKQIIAISLNVAGVKPKEGSKADKKMDTGKKEMKVEKKEYKKSKK